MIFSFPDLWCGSTGVRELDAGKLGEPFAGHVLARTRAGRGIAQTRLGLRNGDELGHCSDIQRRVHRQDQRLARELDHRHQVFHRIEVQFVDLGAGGQGVGGGEDGVAVARLLGDEVGADVAVGAGAILDQEGLSEILRQPLAEEAGDEVERASGREGDDDAHRFRGPGLRLDGSGGHCQE
jgi:hypothetical protein